MINLKQISQWIGRSGYALAIILIALPSLAAATPSKAPSATTAPAPSANSAQTATNQGTTSSGGSFFTPPERAKDGTVSADQALKSTEVPEPGMIALFAGGALLTLAATRRRRRRD